MMIVSNTKIVKNCKAPTVELFYEFLINYIEVITQNVLISRIGYILKTHNFFKNQFHRCSCSVGANRVSGE